MMSKISYDKNILDLLILLCNDELSEKERERALAAAASVTDWNLFNDVVRKNGIAALAWYNLKSNDIFKYTPESIQTLLEGAMQRTVARVEFIVHKALDISNLLGKNGIKVLFLKGVALENSVYGKRGLRQMNDVDILIDPLQCRKAWNILRRAGYANRPVKSIFHKMIIMHLGNHLPELFKNGISVDMHHRLFHMKGTEIVKEAIIKPGTITIADTTQYVLPPRIAFLALVRHISKHELKGEFQIRLFTDLFLILKYYRELILCDALAPEAEATGVTEGVKKTLFLLSHYWHSDIPEKFLEGTTSSDKQEYEEWFIEGVFRAGEVIKSKNRDAYRNILTGIDTPWHKFLYLLGDLFPSISFMKERYRLNSTFSVLLRYPQRLGKTVWFFRALFSK